MQRNTGDIVVVNRHMQELNPLFVGEEWCAPGHSFGPAVRGYTLLHYVAEGTGTVCKDGVTDTVHAGEAFWIFPGEIVTYTADTADPWHYQWIAFDGTLTERIRTLPTVMPLQKDILSDMLEVARKDLPEYRLASLLFRLYVQLFEGRKVNNHYVRRVRDHVQALYMTPLRVEDIADQLGLDRRYLSRIFKQQMGETIQSYILHVRMDAAKMHLTAGCSVEQTANLCGYSDTCVFSRMFKKQCGLSPQVWKKGRDSRPTFCDSV